MTLPKIADIKELDNSSLVEEITAVKKQLFDLRLKRATRQDFKPHLFKHSKHKLAQLLSVEQSRAQSNL